MTWTKRQTWQAFKLALAIFWTVVLVWGLSAPASTVSRFPIHVWDKAIHFGLFLFYGFLWLAALGRRWPRILAVTIFGVCLAAGTEWYQNVAAKGRQGTLGDFAADLLGLLAALTAYFLAPHLLSKTSAARNNTSAGRPPPEPPPDSQ